MSDHLLELGAGGGSKVESVKAGSEFLRGTIAQQFVSDSPYFAEAEAQLLKFHGSYQQEDRDQRRARRDDGAGKAYQFMIRTRVPGGVLTATQYLAEDALAEKFGNGTLRVTTRQGFQHHGVLKGNLRSAIAEINAAELTTLAACGDVNRNVMTCPAPIRTDADEAIVGVAQAIARHLTPATSGYREIWVDGERVEHTSPEIEPIYGQTYLPRKFKIGIARPDDNCVDVFTQDIGLVASVEDERLQGFTILVGGGMGMTHGKAATYPRLATPLCFTDADDVLKIVEAIVTTYRDWGDRNNRKHARFKYVVEERGIEWIRSEVQRRGDVPLKPPRPVRLRDIDDHLGWQPQPNGRWCFGLFIENGRIKDDDNSKLRTALRTVVDRFRPNIRLTPQQNILLTDIRVSDIPEVTWLLESHRVCIEPRKLGAHRHAMACPALPTCGLALTDAERVLPDVVAEIDAELEKLGIDERPLSIRMTGCPNGCARPYMGDVGFVGRSKNLYDIFLGGDWANTRLNWIFATGVRLDELASTIAPLLKRWNKEGEHDESFGDFCHRLGRDALATASVAISSERAVSVVAPTGIEPCISIADDCDLYGK